MVLNLKAPAIIAKMCVIALGIVVMGIGIHSHFSSSWWRVERSGIKPHKICSDARFFYGGQLIIADGVIYFTKTYPCPHIAMEQYFVSMVIICFILSVANFITIVFLDEKSRIFKLVDMIYHVAAAVLLLIAAIVYIVSAEQIKNLGINVVVQYRTVFIHFLHGEKIAAGALTLLLAVLYAITGILIGRQRSTSFNFK